MTTLNSSSTLLTQINFLWGIDLMDRIVWVIAVVFALFIGEARSSDFIVYSHLNVNLFRYDENGDRVFQFAEPESFGDLLGLARGADGSLYASSAGFNRIHRFDISSGTYLNRIYDGPGLSGATRITVGPDNLIYASNRLDNSIARIDPDTGTFVDYFVPSSSGILDTPRSLVFGPDGNLYVGNDGDDSIKRFDGVTGDFIDTFVSSGSGGLDFPGGIIFGKDKNLYVCSRNTNSILRYSGRDGSFIDIFIDSAGNSLDIPVYMAIDARGDFFVCSVNNDSILQFDWATGDFVKTFIPSGTPGINGPSTILYLDSPLPASNENWNLYE